MRIIYDADYDYYENLMRTYQFNFIVDPQTFDSIRKSESGSVHLLPHSHIVSSTDDVVIVAI